MATSTVGKPKNQPRKRSQKAIKSAEENATQEPAIWETVAAIGAQISDEEWQQVPDDSSTTYKKHLYGAPEKLA